MPAVPPLRRPPCFRRLEHCIYRTAVSATPPPTSPPVNSCTKLARKVADGIITQSKAKPRLNNTQTVDDAGCVLNRNGICGDVYIILRIQTAITFVPRSPTSKHAKKSPSNGVTSATVWDIRRTILADFRKVSSACSGLRNREHKQCHYQLPPDIIVL